MARLLKAEDIPMDIRLPHLKRYQRQLRDALLNPTLSVDQRADIKDRLTNLGKPRVYVDKSAHGKMAAVAPAAPAPSSAEDPREQLLLLTKKELLDLAEVEGVGPFKSKDTKEFIADAVLAMRATRTT